MSRGWDEIRIVTSPDELEKVYRFRYKIYVEEMERPQADADHERKRIKDKLDKGAYNIAAFKGGEIVGVVRVNFSRSSDISYYADFYRMDTAGSDHPAATSIVTRLMIEPSLRSGTLATRLACHCYELALRKNCRWGYIDCNDHLVAFFSSLGFKTYLGKIEHQEYGLVTPMRLDCLNIEYLRSIRSPFRASFEKTVAALAMNSPMDKNMPVENVGNEMRSAFDAVMHHFLDTPAMKMIREGRITKLLYQSVLREIYHYTKEDPQMQAYAATYFRGDDRETVKLFLRHAISEVGHEKLALDDLKTLGENVREIERSQPLPATIAFTAFGFYKITFGNPVAYLGYLYFLEFLPTQHGGVFRNPLLDAGIPEEALSFLRDHMTVDVGHNQLMEKYLTQLVHDRADLDAAIYAMRVTADLYAKMLQDAFARVEKPCDYGTAWEEVKRTRTPAVAQLLSTT